MSCEFVLRCRCKGVISGVYIDASHQISLPAYMHPRERRLPASPRRAKKHKRTYFFQPTNSLVGGENLDAREQPEGGLKPPRLEPDQIEISTKLAPPAIAADPSSPRVDVTVQSSDDSFDGIKWRTTPRKPHFRNAISTTMPSSPLREMAKDMNVDSKPAGKHSATITDEQANSVLNKYGTDFVNISSQPSSTPNLHKTKSDLSAPTSRENDLDVSPVLQRSRSSGVERLAFKPSLVTSKSMTKSLTRSFNSEPKTASQPTGSTLKSWIDRFDSNVKDFDGESSFDFSKLMLCQTSSAKPEEPISVSAIDDIDFSDDFSDSELVSSDPVKVEARKTTPETESDPFSSDDEMFNDLEEKSQTAQTFQKDSTPSNTSTNDIALAYLRKGLARYKIAGLLTSHYKVRDKALTQLVMTVLDADGATSKLLIRGEASLLNFEKGDIIHIISTNDGNPRLVDDDHNLLIWNPDTLVSPTSVSLQLTCARKSVLMSRLKFPGVASIHLITGTILHEIFQSCFQEENWTLQFMSDLSNYMVDQRRIEIFSLGEDMMSNVKRTIEEQLPYLREWFDTYYKKVPSLANSIQSATNPTAALRKTERRKTVMFAVSKALEIEETIWSPMFGINGKIDVTIEAKIRDGSQNQKMLMPLEIKTGREHISHHAQSALYTLLFKDRYEIDLTAFLLVYTKEKITKKEEIGRNDLKSLVNLRNQLTEYFKLNTRKLPNLLRLSLCDRCEIQQACMTINYLAENGTGEDSGLGIDNYNFLVDHLSEEHKTFYNMWDSVITKEESSMSRLKRELWLMNSTEREQNNGRCISNLIVTECKVNEGSEWFEYTFKRAEDSHLISRSFQLSQLGKNDRVTISSENGHYALSQGYIVKMRKDLIVVSAMRKLNQLLSGSYANPHASASNPPAHFRIDKDEMFYGMGLARFNILNLFLADGDTRRREILVDKKSPNFTNSELKFVAPKYLNVDQVAAIEKVILAKDFSLILGMPGTGKTTVISELIKSLVENGKSVLLTSYTHSAVDNILLKLKDGNLKILRIGSSSKVHQDIQTFLPADIHTYDDFHRAYLEPQVVAATCLGIDDIAFSLGRTFDYCILDEASQVTMPVSLGPLRFCKRFVLVGDHHQLPPLVQHGDADVRQLLSTSLFKTLGDAFPESVSELTYQFRMCEDIMMLSNVLVYENRLKCGSEKVARNSLLIPYPSAVDQLLLSGNTSKSERWMDQILDPKRKVIFLNHDKIPGYETCIGDKIENLTEARLVFQIVDALTTCGIPESGIGVMALYRSQLRLLMRGLSDKKSVECLTADQFQGRDKDCVVISLVRSNKELKVGDLLKEWRRINVAITRSRTKLIILGSAAMMRSIDILKRVLSLIEQKNWMRTLSPDALSVYRTREIPDTPQKPRVVVNKDELMKNHPIARDIFRSS